MSKEIKESEQILQYLMTQQINLAQKLSSLETLAQPHLTQLQREKLAIASSRIHALFDILELLPHTSEQQESFAQLCEDCKHFCSEQGIGNSKRRFKLGKTLSAVHDIISKYNIPKGAEDALLTLIDLFAERRSATFEKFNRARGLRLSDIRGALRETLHRHGSLTKESISSASKRIYGSSKLEEREVILIDDIKEESKRLKKFIREEDSYSSAAIAMVRSVLGGAFPKSNFASSLADIQECEKIAKNAPERLRKRMGHTIERYKAYVVKLEKGEALDVQRTKMG